MRYVQSCFNLSHIYAGSQKHSQTKDNKISYNLKTVLWSRLMRTTLSVIVFHPYIEYYFIYLYFHVPVCSTFTPYLSDTKTGIILL